jgi:uncharacterized SAM-binding protein YcdF (DUF218 family)
MNRARILIVLLILVVGALYSGTFLVIDAPGRSDVILVLAGETNRRPARGLELLEQGYAPKVILDVPADARIYEWNATELAQRYAESLARASAVTICPIHGRSTKAEAKEAGACLQAAGARSVLLVTSDYHTRRALSTLRRELPAYHFSIAAAYDPAEFGTQWWRHRQWAKVSLDEWLRLIWWEAIDRWQ